MKIYRVHFMTHKYVEDPETGQPVSKAVSVRFGYYSARREAVEMERRWLKTLQNTTRRNVIELKDRKISTVIHLLRVLASHPE